MLSIYLKLSLICIILGGAIEDGGKFKTPPLIFFGNFVGRFVINFAVLAKMCKVQITQLKLKVR